MNAQPNSLQTGVLRMGVGLAQGILAWALLKASETNGGAAHEWAISHPITFAVVAMLTAFIPFIVVAEAGRMRRRRLLFYITAAAAVLAALAVYDIWRDPLQVHWKDDSVRLWPSPALLLCTALLLFITNQLLEHRERGYTLYAHYQSHFDDSWMRGIQFALSLAFGLLVLGIFQLGAALFDLIGIKSLRHVVIQTWFNLPMLAMSFAAAFHVTDVRPALITGARNLGLMLLAWLLPLIVLLGSGFLVTLCVTGLTPLWETRYAATLLLCSAALTMFLLNAAYKDGDVTSAPAAPVRWAGRAAGPMMLVFALLATYAIALRVGQHGWTPDRVWGTVVTIMALVYGLGYAWATLTSALWLKRLEQVNITACFILLGMLLLMLTPVADPARLSVNSQVARLQAGVIKPADFDYGFLRFDTGRYGIKALALLAGDRNKELAALAQQAQALTNQEDAHNASNDALRKLALTRATIYPQGVTLPEDFVQAVQKKDFRSPYGASCLTQDSECEIYVLARGPFDAPALIVYSGAAHSASQAIVFGRNASGAWQQVGYLNNMNLSGVVEMLRQGKASPVRPRYNDLMAGKTRLKFRLDGGFEIDPEMPPSPLEPSLDETGHEAPK